MQPAAIDPPGTPHLAFGFVRAARVPLASASTSSCFPNRQIGFARPADAVAVVSACSALLGGVGPASDRSPKSAAVRRGETAAAGPGPSVLPAFPSGPAPPCMTMAPRTGESVIPRGSPFPATPHSTPPPAARSPAPASCASSARPLSRRTEMSQRIPGRWPTRPWHADAPPQPVRPPRPQELDARS